MQEIKILQLHVDHFCFTHSFRSFSMQHEVDETQKLVFYLNSNFITYLKIKFQLLPK